MTRTAQPQTRQVRVRMPTDLRPTAHITAEAEPWHAQATGNCSAEIRQSQEGPTGGAVNGRPEPLLTRTRNARYENCQQRG
jgi:hypothetical protein